MAQSQDTEHMAGEVLQLGAVASVDHANATCTVQLGDLETGELPWVAQRAGGTRYWSPPTVGEQCLVFCPEGDVDNGVVLVGIYSNNGAAPFDDPDLIGVLFPDGARIAYNHVTHALDVTLPEGGTATIDAPGGVTFNCDVTVNGKVTATDDVLAAGISLKNHKHGGVQAGAAQTGAPA